MKTVRRRWAAILVLLILAAAGCGTGTNTGSNGSQEGPVHITFWHGMNDDSSHGQVLNQLIDEYHQSQDRVRVAASFKGSYTNLEKALTSAIAAKVPPTVVQNTDSMLSNLVRAQAVVALDSLVPEDHRADYPDSLLQSTTFDGRLYGLPFNKSAIVLIYDKIIIPDPPTTWDDFRESARRASIKGQRYGTAFEANVYYFAQFFEAAGGEWLQDGKAAFDSEVGVQALQFIVDMDREGSAVQMKPGEYQSNYFNEGRAAMIVTTSASLPYINPASGNPWGVAPLFAGPIREAVPIAGGNVSIVSGVKPEEAEAAADFILWLTGRDATLKWATGKTGYGPVRRSARETQQWQNFVQEHPEYQVLAEALAKGVVQPTHPQWQNVQKEITTAVEATLLGQSSPKQALEKAAQAADEVLARP